MGFFSVKPEVGKTAFFLLNVLFFLASPTPFCCLKEKGKKCDLLGGHVRI